MRTRNITLVDSVLLEKNAAPAAPEPAVPGSTLPDDFPKAEFDSAQLVLLEELCFQYTREFILRFFRIISTPVNRYGTPVGNNVSNIACQTVVLAKLLGLNEDMSWHDIAEKFGMSKHTVLAAKDNVLHMLDRMATRATRSAEDWHALALLAGRQARAYAIKAASCRTPKNGARVKTNKPVHADLSPVIHPDFKAGN
jgi:hypothetical protein